MRYRKSVKISKGVRVNFSKSGISTTVGGRGMSVNTGKNGTYLNTGIPGTGLYDRQKIGGDNAAYKNSSGSSYTISEVINLKLDDNGVITFYDASNNIIDDPVKIRKIKSTPAFKAERERMMKVRFDEVSAENEKFVNIYQLAPNVCSEKNYLDISKTITLRKYKKEVFAEVMPTKIQIEEILKGEAENNIKTWKFWTVKKQREAYVSERLDLRFDEAKKKWQQEKESFEKKQEQIEEARNKAYLSEYNAAKDRIDRIIEGNSEYIEKEIENWLTTVTLPVEFNMQFEYYNNALYIDLDLPEIEDLPQEKAVVLTSGTTKKKSKTQKELKEDYINCVFGLAIFFSANLFNVSPQVKEVVISGYTQRSTTKVTEAKDEYIYSIRFIRELFEKKRIEDIKLPLDFCMEFENRCNITSTLLLKKIEPFEK